MAEPVPPYSDSGDPLQCKALKHLFPRLAKTINPVVVSTKLLGEGIIDERTWEEARKETSGPNFDRNLKILEHLLRAVRATPSLFEPFCTILREEEVTNGLADELEDELQKLKLAQHVKELEGRGEEDIPEIVPRCGKTVESPASNEPQDKLTNPHDVFLEQKPNLQAITIIRYEDKSVSGQVERKKFKLLETISNSWREMGQYLGIPKAVLSGWEQQYPRNYDRADAVLGRFLNNGSEEYPCTWNGLIELVVDLGHNEDAKEFKHALILSTTN